jgi:phosphatidylinositol-4-phosphate 3-kinase
MLTELFLQQLQFCYAPLISVCIALQVGEDLQQDMLTIQMVRIMDKLWLKEGIDLKMVTFSCVPTGHKRGM